MITDSVGPAAPLPRLVMIAGREKRMDNLDAQARAAAWRDLADRADPRQPEVSFFGDHGHVVGEWIRKQAEYEERRAQEQAAQVPENLQEPDDPAAHALAEYIASHPVSTIMAAFRHLGWKLDFELTSVKCPQCGDAGACNGGPCPLRAESTDS